MSFDVRQLGSNLPEGWSYKRLGDVATINGNSIKKKEAPQYISYVDISSVSTGSFEEPTKIAYAEAPSRARRRLQNNDFIISTVRPNLKQYAFIENVEDNWVASTGFCVVSTYNANAAWYLYAVVTSDLFNDYLVRVADGGAYPAFNPKEIEDAVILWPDHKSLVFLNDFVMQINQKVKINSQTNKTLEEMAQAIFKSWFVDFDPVKAKMNGEQPEGMDAASASLFPEKLVSETGLPEGWIQSEIGDEVTVVGSGTPSKKNDDFWVDGDIHWTSPKDLSGVQDKVLLDTASKVTEAGLKKISSGLLPIDTVLLSSRAPVGYLALAKVPMAINQGYIAMKCEKQLPPEFVLQWCVHRMDEIKQRASGSTFAEISKKSFKPISVVVPSGEVLSAYRKVVKPLYDAIASNARQNEQLSTLRDTLLPKLLSGEVNLEEDRSLSGALI